MSNEYVNISQEIESIMNDRIGQATYPILENSIQSKKSMIDNILIMCNMFMGQIDKHIIEETTWGGYRAKMTKKKDAKYTWTELMQYGARIIYLIRTLLTGEEISFLFGVTAGGETKTALVKQNQILSSMEKVGKSAIGISISSLNNTLMSLQNLEKEQNLARKNEWSLVQTLASVSNGNDLYTKTQKEKNAHQLYQKKRQDTYVYFTFSGKSSKKTYYYDVNHSGDLNNLQYYNFGWLWEWYNSILFGNDDMLYQVVSENLKEGSIQPIMLSPDNVAGTKMGDFMDAQNRQIQAKFNNRKIISYNNIKVILIQLTNALQMYKTNQNSIEAQNNLIQVLQTHFFPEGALIGNRFTNQKIDEILNKLKSTIIK